MISTDKPNPFAVLGLSTTASQEEIVTRGQELCDLAENDEQRLLYRWAMEQLITHPNTRLGYELFEPPDAQYEDREWEKFARDFRRNPIDLSTLTRDVAPPKVADFDLPGIASLLLDDLLEFSDVDLRTAIDHCPFPPGHGPPPLEVRDVIFG